MSLPPTTVKIKRKRTDEPVDFLRVHEANGKRQRRGAGDFVFERQAVPETRNDAPTIKTNLLSARPIKPLHRTPSSQSLGTRNRQATPQPTLSQTQNAADGGVSKEADVERHTQGNPFTNVLGSNASSLNNGTPHNQQAEVRRFHISRNPASQVSPPRGQGQPRKRKVEATIFVERRTRPKTPDDPNHQLSAQAVAPVSSQDIPSTQSQKKPGRNARTPVPRTPEATPNKPSTLPERTANVPSGLRNRWDVTSEQLVAEMQAYTLQEIGYNIAESETPKPSPRETPQSNRFSSSKFKPTPPTKRYAERYPEVKEVAESQSMDIEEDLDMDLGSDDDYVVDTYIRVPVEALEPTARNIGLLILDSQVDIEEFYRGDEDSDEEEELEDEDENAENHYSADYPDEEVDSDDEYGRNAYNYRNNGSDDEFDATYSDSDNESTKYPWKTKTKPWMAPTKEDSD